MSRYKELWDCKNGLEKKRPFYLKTTYFAVGGKDIQTLNFVLTVQDQFQLCVRTSAQCVEMESVLSICVH